MDKATFFAKLTNQAAMPDPKFIASLKAAVVAVAAGGAPPSSGSSSNSFFNNPTAIVTGAVITAAVAGGMAWGIIGRGAEPEAPALPVAQVDESQPEAEEVLAVVDEPAEDPDQSVEGASDLPAATSQLAQSISPSTSRPNPTPASEPDSPQPVPAIPSDPEPQEPEKPEDPDNGVELDENYTVSFWSVDSFKLGPKFPAALPDYTAVVPEIRFNWGEASPAPGLVSKNQFMARARATKYLPAGNYQLSVLADDGVRVYVDGQLLIDRWVSDRGRASDDARFKASDEKPVEIIIEYYDNIGQAYLIASIAEFGFPEISGGTISR